ncbi:MAG: GAF domain-containing sensor histidine kinase [Deltaproteobacteria bacterium]|nr:GAF domain-containing sensor histidine kinase [Deltaproteobacteria bacterium]
MTWLRYLELPGPDLLAGLDDDTRRTVEHINQKVAALGSLDDVMHFLYDAGRKLIPADRMSLAFVEEGGRRAVARWTRAEYEPLRLDTGWSADLGSGSLADVLRLDRPRILSDLEAYASGRPESESSRLLRAEGIRSSMACPVSVDGRVIGLLFRSSRRPDAFDERHVRIHQALAERLGQAVEKAWRIEQLESAMRAYTEMLGFVSHELKSPLAAIISLGRTLTGGLLGPLQPEHAEKVDRMVLRAESLVALVREFLDLARIESGELRLKIEPDVRIQQAVIEPAVEELQPQMEQQRVAFSLRAESGASCACDPGLIRIVVLNLLGNAVKYSPQGARVEIELATEPDAVRVSVENEGPGFAPGDERRLFRRFSRLSHPELSGRRGTGVGLYICWRIIQAHGGRIWAESEQGRWARFSFRLPREQRA